MDIILKIKSIFLRKKVENSRFSNHKTGYVLSSFLVYFVKDS